MFLTLLKEGIYLAIKENQRKEDGGRSLKMNDLNYKVDFFLFVLICFCVTCKAWKLFMNKKHVRPNNVFKSQVTSFVLT